MALKSDRNELQTDISFFMNETATRGGVVSISTGGSGAAMDQGAALVTYTAASGKPPIGILLNDMVNLDLTRQHINQHKDEVQLGGKVTILRKGYVVTNKIESVTVAPGDVAYAAATDTGSAGNITNVCPPSVVASGNLAIGRFLSRIDEDGYAKVEVNLPNHGTNN